MGRAQAQPTIDSATHSALLAGLAGVAERYPCDDKLLVCRPRGVGRELLHALATAGYGWLGFRVQTPRDLAKQLAAPALAEQGLAPIDGFDELAVLDEAIDTVLASKVGKVLREMGEVVGFRTALAGSVRELRLAGIQASTVAKAGLDDLDKGAALAAIQNRYEEGLHARAYADLADVLRLAVASLHGDSAALPAERVCLLPGAPLRGLTGELVESLLRHGAEVLPADPVIGLDPPTGVLAPLLEELPTSSLSYLFAVDELPEPGPPKDLLTPEVQHLDIDVFAAASPVDELREVLRRAMTAGIPWDAVEIVTTDRVVYGTALDSIAPGLVHGSGAGSRVTHAAGLPVSRTRVGRAATGYLRWIQDDFPEDIIRSLLQSGLLRAERADGTAVSGSRAARLLRELRIGWGRERYLRQIDWALDNVGKPPARPDRRNLSDEQKAEITERKRQDLAALRDLFGALLDATPATPDRLDADGVRVSPAAIAAGLATFLELVPTPEDPDTEGEAKRRILEVLHRAAATLQRDTRCGSAVAILERFIDLRVPSPSSHGRVPWSSAGGYLHFSDIDHGGLSGRRHTFIVGLDAGRFPGIGPQNALLLDHDRGRLPTGLPISADMLEERRYELAGLLARLRGRVTLSYAAWDASEGRNLSPSPLLLQAFRLKTENPRADYQALHDDTRPICGPVPSASGKIDAADIWLDELDDNGLLRQGVDAVRQAFPGLDCGLAARSARFDATVNAHNGIIAPRPDHLDPRRRGLEEPLSASRLETLATCPLKYFFGYVLRLRAPDDVVFEPDLWLDAKNRGSMFHNVYEQTIEQAKKKDLGPASAELRALAESIFDEQIDKFRFYVPVPSEAVFERERRVLRADLDVFLNMLSQQQGKWFATEWSFGYGDQGHPFVPLSTDDNTAYLGGFVDRVDELDGGALGIVDYKTGRVFQHGAQTGTYNGGRRLQHALYARAVEHVLERRVAEAAYHFPTQRGGGDRYVYKRALLNDWPVILDELFEMIAAGRFPPAFDKEPPCKICDFKALCRVTESSFGKIDSPIVRWAQENNQMKPEYEQLQRVRQIDDPGETS